MAIRDGDKKPQVSSDSTQHTVPAPSDGIEFGVSAADKIGFHGIPPAAQRSNAAQAAVSATGATNSSPYGFTTAAQANAAIALLNEIRAALVEKGLIKGA